MANNGDTLSTVANAYEQKYHAAIANFVKKCDPVAERIYSKAKRKNVTVGGASNNVVWARSLIEGGGDGALDEGGDFATAGASSVGQYTLAPVRWNFSVEWTGLTEEIGTGLIAKEYGAKIAARQLKHLQNRVAKTVCRWLMHDGTPVWGRVNGTPNTSGDDYFVIDDDVPFAFFEKGQILTARDGATGGTEQLSGGVQTIQELDPENRRIYVSSVAGLADNDYISLSTHYDETVPNGLMNLVSNTGTVQGVNRATVGNSDAEAWVLSNGADPLTSDFIDKVRDRAWSESVQREGGYMPQFIVSPLTRRIMSQACIGQNRFTDMKGFSLGNTAMKVATEDGWKEVEVSTYMRDYQIIAADLGAMLVATPEGKEGGYPAKLAGDSIMRKTGSAAGVWADAYQSVWIWSGNFGVEKNFTAMARGYDFVAV